MFVIQYDDKQLQFIMLLIWELSQIRTRYVSKQSPPHLYLTYLTNKLPWNLANIVNRTLKRVEVQLK